MFDRIAFVIGEAAQALRRNLALSFAAATTAAISIYLIAGLYYVVGRVETYMKTLPGQFEMRVNLKDGTTYAQIHNTAEALRDIPGVSKAIWLPRNERWKVWQREHPELTEGYGFTESPFPDAFKVEINDLNRGDAVAKTIQSMPVVDPNGGVQYYSQAQNIVAQWMKLFRTMALGLGGILLVVAGILIWNAIRLTVESRRMEIQIMRLVGASRLIVQIPFVIEGAVQGAVGGILAALGIWRTQEVVQARLTEAMLSVKLAPFPLTPYLLTLAAIGAGYGGMCSVWASRVRLRARGR